MTNKILYTFPMNILSSSPVLDFIWVIALFLACFLLVHTARLLLLGWKHRKTPPQAQPPATAEKKTPVESKPQEPVYYIVEKKRRTKTTFCEPKQIRFK